MKAYHVLVLLPLLSMSKCEREQPEPTFTLPPVTQSGANTLGFVVDGRVWITYGSTCYYGVGGCATNKVVTYYNARRRELSLFTNLTTPKHYESFDLQLDSLAQVGSYQTTINPTPGANARAVRSLSFGDKANETYYGSFLKPGKGIITITKLDTIQHIIAGTFEGTLRQGNDSTKLVRITEGRFDVLYQ
jgi:hypothetical protein